MKMVLEQIHYNDEKEDEQVVVTNRIMDEPTFNIYLQMVEDFNTPDFEVEVLNYWSINQEQKIKALQDKLVPIRIHSNYLTIHQDIDSLYNNRG